MNKNDNVKAEKDVADLMAAGISKEVAQFVTYDVKKNVYGREGLEVGDKITLTDFVCQSDVIDEKTQKWLAVSTTGDADSISLKSLIGTQKRAKYFDAERKQTTFASDFDVTEALTLPDEKKAAVLAIQKLMGVTLQCVAVATECGLYNTTYRLFKVISEPESDNKK